LRGHRKGIEGVKGKPLLTQKGISNRGPTGKVNHQGGGLKGGGSYDFREKIDD